MVQLTYGWYNSLIVITVFYLRLIYIRQSRTFGLRQWFLGDKILLGAGGPIDGFWNMYAVHKTPEVLEILSGYKIGKLKSEDRVSAIIDYNSQINTSTLQFKQLNSYFKFNVLMPFVFKIS